MQRVCPHLDPLVYGGQAVHDTMMQQLAFVAEAGTHVADRDGGDAPVTPVASGR